MSEFHTPASCIFKSLRDDFQKAQSQLFGEQRLRYRSWCGESANEERPTRANRETQTPNSTVKATAKGPDAQAGAWHDRAGKELRNQESDSLV